MYRIVFLQMYFVNKDFMHLNFLATNASQSLTACKMQAKNAYNAAFFFLLKYATSVLITFYTCFDFMLNTFLSYVLRFEI